MDCEPNLGQLTTFYRFIQGQIEGSSNRDSVTDVFLLNMALCLMHHNVGARVAESEILWTVEVPSQLHRYQ